MHTEVAGLLVAGEAVGGANGANRLSGNAITEALVFGRQAGRSAAALAKSRHAHPKPGATQDAIDLINADAPRRAPNSAAMIQTLQRVMADDVGPLRSEAGLRRALAAIEDLNRELGERPFGGAGAFDPARLDWFDLRNMLTVAQAVTQSALRRTESRGAHQREDFPGMLPEWHVNQTVRLHNGRMNIASKPAPVEVAAQ